MRFPRPRFLLSAIALSQLFTITGEACAQQGLGLSGGTKIVGDFFGSGGRMIVTVNTATSAFHTSGFILNGSLGDPNSILVFEQDGTLPANDFFSVGTGTDASGDGLPDTFAMSEPLPPNDVPTSPGPGFVFDGGTVVYTRDDSTTLPVDGAFQDGERWFASYSFTETVRVDLPGGTGAAVRRIKLAENNSPIPTNRVYGDYSFFRNVIGGTGDVNRYMIGYERLGPNGWGSIDIRLPFAATVDSNQLIDGGVRGNTELGDATIVGKLLLYRTERQAVSSGLGLSIPAADGLRVSGMNGQQFIQIDNHAFHLLPFVGFANQVGRGVLQGFVQLDVGLNGNPVFGNIQGDSLPRIGTLQEATLLFIDVSYSWPLYESEVQPNCSCGHHRPPDEMITKVAPLIEFHYSTTLEDQDRVVGNGVDIGPITRRFDVLNVTLGTLFRLKTNTFVTPAVVLPLRDDHDRHFDYEVSVQLNQHF